MSNFPPELLFDILSRLPPKDLIRSLCVSKAWYAVIHDQRFVKAHFERSNKTNSALTLLVRSYPWWVAHQQDLFSLPFDDDDETFGVARKIRQPLKSKHPDALGYSVNGLVCIHDGYYRDIALWNPAIQKFKKIPLTTFEPQPPDSRMIMKLAACYGFGYDSGNEDYKLVGIMEYVNRDSRFILSSQVQIYSLKSNSWKRIENMPCNGFQIDPNGMVFLNGALCWLMYNVVDENQYIILTIDLASEKYQEFPTPVDQDANTTTSLVVLEDCLCFCVNQREIRNDFWVMKEYGVTESWTLLFSIVQEEALTTWCFGYYRPLAFSKKTEMVLLRKDHNGLVWFDLEKKIATQVEIHGLAYFDLTICVHGSLCLLDGDPVIGGRQDQVPSTSNV